VLTTPHRKKKNRVTKYHKKPRNRTDVSVRPKQWKRDMRFGTWNVIGSEVNAEKAKYMVMSRDQNAGQNGYIQIGNESFETVKTV
jgi:hypothetical protein